MNKERILEILQKYKEDLEKDGYKVAYIACYGSNNYGLDLYTDTYKSDLDAKAVIVPDLDALVYNSKPVSFVKKMEFGECNIQDIRVYMTSLIKANPAYIETLYTDYFIIDDNFKSEMSQIISKRDDLVYALRGQFMRAIYGMMCEKDVALCHPYPATMAKIEKWGWDGKQLSHNYRLLCLMTNYFFDNKPLKECFCPDQVSKTIIINYKLNQTPTGVDEATYISNRYVQLGKSMRAEILSKLDEKIIDYSVKDEIIALSRNIIKSHIEKSVSYKCFYDMIDKLNACNYD